MRYIMFLFLCVAFTTIPLFAQTPAISKKYSDAEIAEIISRYKNSRSTDVRVSGDLLQKFRTDFPDAKCVEWETNGEIYEVEFKIKLSDAEAYYDKEGNLLMYKLEISEKHLPAIVKTAAEAKYPKYRFDDIDKVVKGSRTFYKIEMELKKSEVKMVISETGEIIR